MADGEGREQGTAGNPSPARLLLLEVSGSGDGRGHRAPGLGRQGINVGEGARAPGAVDEGDALVVEVTGGGAQLACRFFRRAAWGRGEEALGHLPLGRGSRSSSPLVLDTHGSREGRRLEDEERRGRRLEQPLEGLRRGELEEASGAMALFLGGG